ncbi:MAG: hypothetical protein RLZZ117_390 [Cyanobacteriota bacterium]|jgi:hypothetical protein
MQMQARLLIVREVRLHQPGAMERARSWRERRRDRLLPQLQEGLRPIVSVEPTLQGERHVHVWSPIGLWPSATGPACSRLISSWLERVGGPAAEAEGSRARDRRCSAHETATNASPTPAGLAEARPPAPASMASP